jgi:hypothetical protein
MEGSMKLEALTKDDWIFAGIGILLVIDLLFLAWFSYSYGPLSFSLSATGAPDGWLGVVAVLATVVAIADLVIERLAPDSQIPAIGGSRTQTRFVLACIAAVAVALKFLFNIHFDLFGFGFWAAVVLTPALVYVARRAHTAAAT